MSDMTIEITTDMTDGLAPHDGIEIELMLAGKKNIAYFETLPDEALPHIDSGAFKYKKHTFFF